MKFKSLAVSFLLLAAQPVFAAQQEQPACPDLNKIKATKLDFVEPSIGGWMAVILHNNFDTKDKWSFLIYLKHATNHEEAVIEARDTINALTNLDHPEYEGGLWNCYYTGPNTNPGIASNPPIWG